MKLTIDNQKGMAFVSNPQNLGELLEAIMIYAQGKSRLIQHIVLDGERLLPNDLTASRKATPLTDIDILEIETSSTDLIIDDELQNLKEILPDLSAACHSMSQVMQSTVPQNVFQQFNDLMDVWEVVKERQAQITKTKGFDVDSFPVNKITLKQHNAELEVHLQKAKLQLERSQFAELSDLLSYELADFADDELKIVNQMVQLVEADNS